MINAPTRPDATAPECLTRQKVAIVGAGIAGLACASLLAGHGHQVTVFEKGRRPGGRVATRRAGGAMFDHGAQFATASSPEFAVLMQRLQARGVMTTWPAASRPDKASSGVAWVGLPGMSALPGAMAADLAGVGVSFQTDRHVSWLHDDNSLRHMPASEARPGSTSSTDGERTAPFDAVILAIPAPQAAPLLASRGHPFVARLSNVVLAPCWAVMASFDDRIPGPDVIRPTDGPLAWIARNSGRPDEQIATSDNWVLHARADWTRAHIENDAAIVAHALLATFHHALGSTAVPSQILAHRWRYAKVETPLGAPFLWDQDAGIGLCGDWCLGPRIEAAFDSGEALARSVMAVS
jgi:predicted NAD/FAD-dependent oxidoreductase